MSACHNDDPRIPAIKSKIRVVPNFPKPGIMFQDVTTLLLDPKAFKDTLDLFVERYKNKNISVVAGIEARGFIFGPPIALAIGAKFVPLRKPRKLPGEVISEEYTLEYGRDCLEMHIGAVEPKERALVVDDLIATGGTLCAAINLLERAGAEVVECACLIELPDLKIGRPIIYGLAAKGDSKQHFWVLIQNIIRNQTMETEPESNLSFRLSADILPPNRWKTINKRICETESKPEEHSLSLSQHSSPSQSDQDQNHANRATSSVKSAQLFPFIKNQSPVSSNSPSDNVSGNQQHSRPMNHKSPQDLYVLGERMNNPNPLSCHHVVRKGRNEAPHVAVVEKSFEAAQFENMIGADVQGKVDGAFDSGYLMTATVNGRVFRGVLFAQVRILCGVEHDDLKRLFYVSKSIRAATVIARQWHFAFSTPTKN